jgi:hypothetical protein
MKDRNNLLHPIKSQENIESDNGLLLKEFLELMEKLETAIQEHKILIKRVQMLEYKMSLIDGLPPIKPDVSLTQAAPKEDRERELRLMSEIESKMTCPITHEPLLDNDVLANDGHAYNRAALQHHYETRKNDPKGARCPLNADIRLTNPEKLKPSSLISYLKKYCDILYGSYEKFIERMAFLRNSLDQSSNKNKESVKEEVQGGDASNVTSPRIERQRLWSSSRRGSLSVGAAAVVESKNDPNEAISSLARGMQNGV